jgi:hypothetical protein
MIGQNEFYCNSKIDEYYIDILRDLITSRDIAPANCSIQTFINEKKKSSYARFYSGWNKETTTIKENLVKTISKKKSNTAEKKILYWLPSEVLYETFNYHEVQNRIRKLNTYKTNVFSDWRIPTLEDIFYVLGDESGVKNFFPFDNSVKKFSRSIKIWTSTPVDEKEAKNLKGCSTNAYFIIDIIHEKKSHHINVDISCANEKAYLLPVRSDEKKPKKTEIRKKPPTPPPTIRPTTGSNILAQFSFIDFTMQTSIALSEAGVLINQAAAEGIRLAREANSYLSAYQTGTHLINSNEHINKAASFLFDIDLGKVERARKIINHIMMPNGLEIIVTGYYKRERRNTMITVSPMVIVRSSQKILSSDLEFRADELFCVSQTQNRKVLCPHAYEKIVGAVKNLLTRVR